MRSNFPMAVFIQTVSGCNSNCKMCPHKKVYAKFGKEEMPEKLYLKILNDLTVKYDGQIGLYLHYEPLIDPRLFDFIKIAKKKCPLASVEISSNAGLLDQKKAKQLSLSGIDMVYFNFNGASKEIYESQMRNLDFEKNLTNIYNFRKIYSGRIRINFVLTDENFGEKEKIRELFPEKDFEVIDQYWAVNRAGNIEINKSKSGETRFKQQGVCVQLDMNLPILANGDVILCCNDWMRTVRIGNVSSDNLLDLWNSPKKHYNYDICKKCD